MKASLQGKRILLGVTGSISAYKAPILVREFVKNGAEVRVVMTESAEEFVTSLALQNTSKNTVVTNMFDDSIQERGSWHIHLAQWCDCMVIAPCSATTLARIANGFADNALTALVLALSDKPCYIFPAMDTDMWLHPATQKNCESVRSFGYHVIEPAHGELASGLVGVGRLPEPIEIVNIIAEKLYKNGVHVPSLKGKKVLITAGPTYERLDAVRFIGNFSTGKMGFALAEYAKLEGAEVILIAGPVALQITKTVQRIDVESAEQMFLAVQDNFPKVDIAIFAAAVADYTPLYPASIKLKKEQLGENLSLPLRQTQDSLAWAGKNKKQEQYVVGFALETDNDLEEGKGKLKRKQCNMIVVNNALAKDSGFGSDKNTITIVKHNDQVFAYPPMSKSECAQLIFDSILEEYSNDDER
jgi:phosphopantothenoylcysteine decarboxylase/phosphopantothenate--cysteine ligase